MATALEEGCAVLGRGVVGELEQRFGPWLTELMLARLLRCYAPPPMAAAIIDVVLPDSRRMRRNVASLLRTRRAEVLAGLSGGLEALLDDAICDLEM